MADETFNDLTTIAGSAVASDDSFPIYDLSANTSKRLIPAEAAIAIVLAIATAGIPIGKLDTDPLARANHTGSQAASTISDFTEAAQDVIGALGLGGSGLTFTYTDGSNTAVIDVNVDGSTLEINTDSLRVKDGGITHAKMAAGTLVNADINAAAAIALTKLATDPLARANHTGTQLAATISDFNTAVATTAVLQTLFDANTMLYATTDNTPVALSIAASRIVGRKSSGDISALTASEVKTILALASTDISDFTEAVQDVVGAFAAAGTGIVVTYNDGAGTLTISQGGMTVNAQTGTTYTTVLADASSLVTLNNASSVVVTVAANGTVAYPTGTILTFQQIGAGQVSLLADTGVTLNTPASLKARAQYSTISCIKTATNTWQVLGDLEPLGQLLNAQTGTTYTFVLLDANRLVTLSNASAITATVPPNSSVAFPIGTHIDLIAIAAGQVTVAAGAGVTVSTSATLKLRAQYSPGTLVKVGTDLWYLVGDLAAS